MKKLQMKSLRSNLFVIIVLLIIAGALSFSSLPGLLKLLKGPTDLEQVNYYDDIDGLYVSGTLYGIYDAYCETTENGKTVSREYIIDAGDAYMGLLVMAKDLDEAENLMEASWDYMDDQDPDGSALAAAAYQVTGTIQSIPYEDYQLYKDYFDYDSLDDDAKSLIRPYYLAVNKVDNSTTSSVIAFSLLGLVLILLAIFFIIWPFTGHYQKSIKQYIAGCPDPNVAREKVEHFLETVPVTNSLRCSRDFICGQSGATTVFNETSKLIWAYQHTTTHKRNFITVGHTYALVLAFADGTRHNVSMKSETQVRENLALLENMCPQAILGYSAELDTMFKKNLSQFLGLRYHTVSQQSF